MKWSEIKYRATNDKTAINYYYNKAKRLSENYPSGIDVPIPNCVIDLVEGLLDYNNIPCYKFMEDYLSVAKTYSDLYNHELRR